MFETERSALQMEQIVRAPLDVARGFHRGGISLKADGAVGLQPVLWVILRDIERVADQPTALTLDRPRLVRRDPQRIGQLAPNLLGNAATQGAPSKEIRGGGAAPDGSWRIAVTDRGVHDRRRPAWR